MRLKIVVGLILLSLVLSGCATRNFRINITSESISPEAYPPEKRQSYLKVRIWINFEGLTFPPIYAIE